MEFLFSHDNQSASPRQYGVNRKKCVRVKLL